MATYRYICTNDECLTKAFTFSRPMDEYQELAQCQQCHTMCKRSENDYCQNFRLKGGNWYAGGYNGASNGIANAHDEMRKAGKDPFKEK